jgi:hypothetical protein
VRGHGVRAEPRERLTRSGCYCHFRYCSQYSTRYSSKREEKMEQHQVSLCWKQQYKEKSTSRAKVAEDQPRLGYRSVSTFRMVVVIRFERSKDFLCTHYCAQILVIGTEEKELGSVITFSQHHQHLHHPIHPSLLRHLSSEPGWQDRTWHDRQSLPATCCSPTISDPEDEEFVFPRHNGRKTSSASDKDGCRRSTGPSQAMRLKHHHLCEANEVLWSVSSR